MWSSRWTTGRAGRITSSVLIRRGARINRWSDGFAPLRRSYAARAWIPPPQPYGAGASAARGRATRRRGRLRAPGRAPPRRAPRPLLPDARLGPRRRGRAAGRAAARLARPPPLRGPKLPALLAVPDRHQQLPEADRAPAQAGAAGRLRPAADPHDATRQPLVESVWIEPYPDERLGVEDRLRRARGALRAARERRARLRRRAPAPAAAAAGRADPARRARLLGRPRWPRRSTPRPRRSTAPSSAPARRWTSACPEQSQQETLRTLGDERVRELVDELRGGMGERRRRRDSLACSPTTRRSRCRRGRPGSAAATRSPTSLPAAALAPGGAGDSSRPAPTASSAFGSYGWNDGRAPLVAHERRSCSPLSDGGRHRRASPPSSRRRDPSLPESSSGLCPERWIPRPRPASVNRIARGRKGDPMTRRRTRTAIGEIVGRSADRDRLVHGRARHARGRPPL